MTLINHEIINKDDIPLLLCYIVSRSGFRCRHLETWQLWPAKADALPDVRCEMMLWPGLTGRLRGWAGVGGVTQCEPPHGNTH